MNEQGVYNGGDGGREGYVVVVVMTVRAKHVWQHDRTMNEMSTEKGGLSLTRLGGGCGGTEEYTDEGCSAERTNRHREGTKRLQPQRVVAVHIANNESKAKSWREWYESNELGEWESREDDNESGGAGRVKKNNGTKSCVSREQQTMM